MYTPTWEERMMILEQVFTGLADASLTLNLAKCEFGKATVSYLGRQVGQGQVLPVEAKVSAISACPIPATRRALRRFLGMAGYYRSFCRNFSTVTHPLTTLLSPKVDFVWTDECQHAFDSVKSLLSPCACCARRLQTFPTGGRFQRCWSWACAIAGGCGWG